jgi:uncharacterized protein YjiK
VGEEETAESVAVAEERGSGGLSKKEAKLHAAATRSLDPWERYRALVDSLEEAIDMLEIADRKARFALVIMGALNVAFFFTATRSEVIGAVPLRLRPFLGFYFIAYAAVALFFFLQAIEALRPRRFRPHLVYPGDAGPEHYPEGLRYHEDIVMRDLEAYRRAWREVRFGQLNAELAVQNHVMARINQDKDRSLRRLYGGLRVLTILAGGLLAIVALSLLLLQPQASPAAPKPALAPAALAPAGGALQPQATRLADAAPVAVEGLRETSGIAWHAALARFFVVGDRGTLAELDAAGRLVKSHDVKGNLEDVAVHGPTGLLVVLSEKKGELVVVDPRSGEQKAVFELDVEALLGRAPVERNQGFEGIAFRQEAGRPGGGTFALVHQRQPARLVTVAFDPAGAPRTLGAGDVVSRHALKPWQDLTAVTWSAALGRLLVIAEKSDRLLVVTPDGMIERDVALPGLQQEGLAFDPEGRLWVADDRQGLLRIDGALQALEDGGRAPEPR